MFILVCSNKNNKNKNKNKSDNKNDNKNDNINDNINDDISIWLIKYDKHTRKYSKKLHIADIKQ